jgi:N-methylhydantoinase B
MMVFTASNGVERPTMMTEMHASGWGSRPIGDGIEGVMPSFMTGFRANSGEAFESELPVMLDGFGFVPDTGGAGEFRGSLAVYRRWRFLADGRVMLRTCRIDSAPKGLAGSKDGTRARVLLTSGKLHTELPAKIMLDIPVKAGGVLTHIQPGAAGYGPPARR